MPPWLSPCAVQFLHLVVDDLCEYPVTFERFGPSTPQFAAVVAACKLFFKHSLFAGSTKEVCPLPTSTCPLAATLASLPPRSPLPCAFA